MAEGRRISNTHETGRSDRITESLTTEVILGGALISTSALAMVGSLITMRPPKDLRPDIDTLVYDALYH